MLKMLGLRGGQCLMVAASRGLYSEADSDGFKNKQKSQLTFRVSEFLQPAVYSEVRLQLKHSQV